MITLTCQCGKITGWYSGMSPNPCGGCSDCGTSINYPGLHEPTKPHDFSLTQIVETDEGRKPLTRCRWCLLTRVQVEARERKRG
jgi:hypothetical protein